MAVPHFGLAINWSFSLLAIMNNIAVNIYVQVLYGDVFIFLGYISRCGIAGSYGRHCSTI